jgi:hypothetical protein
VFLFYILQRKLINKERKTRYYAERERGREKDGEGMTYYL